MKNRGPANRGLLSSWSRMTWQTSWHSQHSNGCRRVRGRHDARHDLSRTVQRSETSEYGPHVTYGQAGAHLDTRVSETAVDVPQMTLRGLCAFVVVLNFRTFPPRSPLIVYSITSQQQADARNKMAADGVVEIARAEHGHVPEIVEIAKSRSLDNVSRSTASKEGFLVSGFAADSYHARIDTAEHFYVATMGRKVVGFLLAYSDSEVGSDEWLNLQVKASLGEFWVIKQVCVAHSFARKGIASKLYQNVLHRCVEKPVIAAVVAKPVNAASIAFHRSFGFEWLADYTPPDGLPRTVWVRHRASEPVLLAQYATAVDLYKHEDSTNWSKLNNFFYITAAMAAAAGFSISDDHFGGISASRTAGQNSFGIELAFLIAALGVVVSVLFGIMLSFGQYYLLSRKEAVMDIERHMAWRGSRRIVGVSESGNRWLRNSPTGLVMKSLPFVVAVFWVISGALIVLL